MHLRWLWGGETMAEKRCTVCGEVKPLDQFREWTVKGRHGYRPLCRVCQKQYESEWRVANRERLRESRARRADKAQVYSRQYRAGHRAAYLIAECRRRCARKGYAFDLDLHVAEIQERMDRGVCEVTGYPLDSTPTTRKSEWRPNAPSIDRIDPSQGYVLANVRVVCLVVNLAMSSWGEQAVIPILRAWCERM